MNEITKEKFDELYVCENLVVNCKTEELANKFLDKSDEFGYHWCDNQSFLENNNWDEYKNETCYWLFKGNYCDKEYFLENGFRIEVFKGFDFESEAEEMKTIEDSVEKTRKKYKYITITLKKQYSDLHEAITDNKFKRDTSVIVRGKEVPLYTKDNKYYIAVNFSDSKKSFKMREVERGQYEK